MGRRAVKIEVRRQEWDKLAEAVSMLIEKRLDNPPSLPELALALATNVSTLKRAFRHIRETTIGAFSRNLRL